MHSMRKSHEGRETPSSEPEIRKKHKAAAFALHDIIRPTLWSYRTLMMISLQRKRAMQASNDSCMRAG